jgi:hypothetical protein
MGSHISTRLIRQGIPRQSGIGPLQPASAINTRSSPSRMSGMTTERGSSVASKVSERCLQVWRVPGVLQHVHREWQR